MTQEVHVTAQVVPVTDYSLLHKVRLKKHNFEMWYRGIRAHVFMSKVFPAVIKANDDWFDKNNIEEGAICGKLKSRTISR